MSAINWSWHGARDRIRDASIADKRLWTSKEHRIEPNELADRAVDAIERHRYRCVQVDVDGDLITITKTLQAQALPAETYPRADPAGALTQSGFSDHFKDNGPVSPVEVKNAIEMSNLTNVTMTIFDSAGAGLTWPERPGPAAMAHYEREPRAERDRDPKL